MPHKIWTGSISFGLVTIPVGLYSATEDHSIHFNQYERGTHDRVRYRRVNERTGKELRYEDIVKGREVDGTLVTVEPSELEEIAPRRSKTIDIGGFVDLAEIDPVFFQKTYWLAPTGKQHERPYTLLRRAMAETNRVGIATFVLRGKEYLTAVRADTHALALNTLFFPDEIRDQGRVVGEVTDGGSLGEKELQMATDLINSMSGPWQPDEYADTYTARVEKLLQDKANGRTPEPEEGPAEPEVIDLTEALRRSADQARARGKTPRGGGGGRSGGEVESRPRGRGKARARAEGGRAAAVEDSAESVSTLTREELQQRARELDIKGRSKLNRAQLEKAITEAPGAHREPRRRGGKAS